MPWLCGCFRCLEMPWLCGCSKCLEGHYVQCSRCFRRSAEWLWKVTKTNKKCCRSNSKIQQYRRYEHWFYSNYTLYHAVNNDIFYSIQFLGSDNTCRIINAVNSLTQLSKIDYETIKEYFVKLRKPAAHLKPRKKRMVCYSIIFSITLQFTYSNFKMFDIFNRVLHQTTTRRRTMVIVKSKRQAGRKNAKPHRTPKKIK